MTTTEPNAGYAGGIAKRSKARRLSYALKGAPMRKKDLRLNAVTGIAEGRKLRDRLSEKMKKASANPGDGMVFCVFAEPDLSALAPGLAELGVTNGASDLNLIMRFKDKLPIGFLVIIRDAGDSKQPVYGHALPLIVEDERSINLNEFALTKLMQEVEARLRRLGMIADESN